MNQPRAAITDPVHVKRIRKFVIQLGKTMHQYGTPSHRLERLLTETTYLLGLNGTFLFTPTSLQFFLWQDDDADNEYIHIARVSPGDIDLNRLSQTYELANNVIAGNVDLDEGLAQLEQIKTSADPYSLGLQFWAWGLTSASFAAICGTGIYDIIAATVFGWLIFLLTSIAQRSERFNEMLEPLAALIIAFSSCALVAFGIQINIAIVILSGIIAFIPGLSLTLGLRELAARDLMSGTARIMDAIMMLFKLYFGAVFGLALASLFWDIAPHTAEPSLPTWIKYAAALGLSTSLIVLFKVRQSDAFWGLLAGILAYAGAELGGHYFGSALGGLVGALIVGVYANSYARIKRTAAHIVLLQGIVLLVPGSKVYMGINSFVTGQEMMTNATSGSQIFLTFMSLIAGLIFANVIMPPRQSL